MIEKLIVISGITLVVFGFVHYLILDKLFPNPNMNRVIMKKWAGIITLSITIIFISCFLIKLIQYLWQQF